MIRKTLTKNKVYDVENVETNGDYIILNDLGEPIRVNSGEFKQLNNGEPCLKEDCIEHSEDRPPEPDAGRGFMRAVGLM